jgi:hypothetical protein
MQLSNILSILSVLSISSLSLITPTSAAVPAFANDKNPIGVRIPNVYAVHFPVGEDGESILKQHFAKLGLNFAIRVKQVGKIANFYSFEVLDKHSEYLFFFFFFFFLCNIPKKIYHADQTNLPFFYHFIIIIIIITSSAPSNILSLPAVTMAHRVNEIPEPQFAVSSPKPEQAAPELIHSNTGVNAARQQLGLTGKGVKVGIVDTGMYYKHPALGGCIGAGCRVASGWDFVGDDFTGPRTTPVPDEDPNDDCAPSAHGTHVGGIVGADASLATLQAMNVTDPLLIPRVPFTGVAPGVTFGAYRVFGCSGGTSQAIMAAAIYRAAEEGCHVINLSIGGGPNFSDDLSAIAAAKVGELGHYVVGANGNDGRSGPYVQGGVGVSPGAM